MSAHPIHVDPRGGAEHVRTWLTATHVRARRDSTEVIARQVFILFWLPVKQ